MTTRVKGIDAYIGKTIKDAKIVEFGNYNSRFPTDNGLVIKFDNAPTIIIADVDNQCCEHRYMNTDDNLKLLVGDVLQDVVLTEEQSERIEEYGDWRDFQFLNIITDKHTMTVANYNEHNGYYGGFDVIAQMY